MAKKDASEQAAPEADGPSADDTMFAFQVPNVARGTVLKVTAPDNVVLHIKVPDSVQAFDTMHMRKGEDGQWFLKNIVREEAVAEVTAGEVQRRSEADLRADLRLPNTATVRLETTKGPINLKIVPSWAPFGAQRFMQLVADQFFTELAVYRAVPDFLVQFGVTDDLAMAKKYQVIRDDTPRGVPIQDGSVVFSASGANTRCSTICIFLSDFPELGSNAWETPIGKVDAESIQTLHKLYTGYGDMPQCGGKGPDPHDLQEKGNDYIFENFPKCDFVKSANWLA